MAAVIAKYDVACCLMHNKSNTEYQNFLIDMLAETQEMCQSCKTGWH